MVSSLTVTIIKERLVIHNPIRLYLDPDTIYWINKAELEIHMNLNRKKLPSSGQDIICLRQKKKKSLSCMYQYNKK